MRHSAAAMCRLDEFAAARRQICLRNCRIQLRLRLYSSDTIRSAAFGVDDIRYGDSHHAVGRVDTPTARLQPFRVQHAAFHAA